MMWGVAAAVASAAAVAVASGAELLACDCAPTDTAAAVAVGRCDDFLLRQRVRITASSLARLLPQPSPPSLPKESPFPGNPSSSSAGSGVRDDKFAPRFDGLRFIETLVTAHR
ncbi:hypothetical protein D1007_15864 [Hordeum vulgare]|nr:hypothetical protein D1007_15864 [Hordeum vulgare]